MSAAPSRRRCRIGLIGFGFIGQAVFEAITAGREPGLEIAFVHNRNADALRAVPEALQLADPAGFARYRPDLVVEVAHPSFTWRYGESFLSTCDYLPVSVTALANERCFEQLSRTARAAGTRLIIPHGALVATDNLAEWQAMWDSVTIEFRKNPEHIDFSESGYDPSTIASETIVYEGPVRGIAVRFPRNVNTMVTCALATVGIDRCQARLVAVPGAVTASIEIHARGRDGALLTATKVQPMIGVSGSEMVESTLASIRRAAGLGPAVSFV